MAVILDGRQTESLLPESYCAPQCPSCKVEAGKFDVNTSCVANSSFLTNCGSCQQCIITYGIENGPTPTTNQLNVAMIKIINLCQNTTVSTQVEALQSQASKLSVIGDYLSSRSSAGAASISMTLTSTSAAATSGAATIYDDGDESAAATTSATANNATLNFLAPSATPLPSYAYIPKATTAVTSAQSTSTAAPTSTLSQLWIAGPIFGSLFGILAVLLVIFFTRRRQRLSYTANHNLEKVLEAKLSPSSLSSPTSQTFPRSVRSSLDSVPNPSPEELATTEIHEMPVVEPVGVELHNAKEAALEGEGSEGWALPVGPLKLLFAESEMRDRMAGVVDSPRHQTYYHP